MRTDTAVIRRSSTAERPSTAATSLRSSRVGVRQEPRRLFQFYVDAKEHVWRLGYWDEILRLEDADPAAITQQQFVREMAWVVLSAGFRESVLRRLFGRVSEAFCDWDAAAIAASVGRCVRSAERVFHHRAKLEAIRDNCRTIRQIGVTAMIANAVHNGPEYFTCLAYIGGITCFHLAKNIGLNTAKPDRHLVRIAQAWGAAEPFSLCARIAEESGDRVGIVDLVLWRYASLVPAYVSQIEKLRFFACD